MTIKIDILGAGLAGSEAALQLARLGFQVRLHDMKPGAMSPAHHNPDFAEIVCSNSLGSQNSEHSVTASGLLKEELTAMGCILLNIAKSVALPAGQALAVDREGFSRHVTEAIQRESCITLIPQAASTIPVDSDAVLVATGPLTTAALAQDISTRLNHKPLYFFDAAAPIIAKESINFDTAFFQDRYNKGEPDGMGSYINCPLEKEDYEALLAILQHGEKTPLHDFEAQSASYFESCLPVEVLASRGPETLRYGPMKPVGLINPHTGRRPYAVVQLRQDNREGTLYNMVGFQTNLKWGVQKQMIQRIPGLEDAEIVRYGVMHRNTFIHSPAVLTPTLNLRTFPHVFFAGQLTGTEGYTESIATGMLAAQNIARMLQGNVLAPMPQDTMLGALTAYITRPEAATLSFQPINSNWGILPPLPEGSFRRKDKTARNQLYRRRSQESLTAWLAENGMSSACVGGC